uniref:Reverse transcriptase domain-containing protein n=1 Tax=Tanacetum cinerariifolium TaxID=118510 RepID=A0A6L2J450_TANCI|nr:reverse transcriptase domain-containing protein [Tanacetum cinerariifolium]
MTTTLKYRDVRNDAIKLMLFLYSLEDRARIWYEKEPPNSILTWDDLVNKFVNQFFPPSKTTHLKNEISRFTQRFEETFSKAWDRFKELLRACPHHGFSKLTQIDMFYNGLTEQDQDSLNAASGGNLLNKTTREALKIIKNKSKISNLVEIVNKQVVAPAKAVEKTCVTCGGAHAYYECIATDSNPSSVCAATGSYNQIPPSVPNEFSSYIKSNEIAIKSMQNQINVLRGDFSKQEENLRRNLNDDMRNILSSFFQNQPLTSGTLSSNTVPNPKGEMKAVTTHSGLAYEGPSIPTDSSLEKVDEQNTKEILDKEHSNSSGSTAQVQPPVVPILIPELDVLRTQSKPSIPYPSRLNDQKLREKATNQMEKFFQIFHDLHFDISFANALLLMPKFASTIKSFLANKDKLFELAKMTLELEDRSITRPKGFAEDVFVKVGKFYFPTDFVVVDFKVDPIVLLLLGRSFLRTGRALIDVYREEITLRVNDESSSNPTLVSESDFCEDPIVKTSPFGESDFFLEYVEDFLNDDSIPTGIENSVYDPEGDILYFENLLKEDPFQLPPMNINQAKSPMEEPEYSFSMGYKHFSTTLDDFTIHDEIVSIEESKVYSNPLFDNDEIYSDELESHCLNVESNFVESLSNHDTLKFDHLEKFSGTLMPIHIAEEERIRKDHDNDSQREEIDIVTDTDELLPSGFENDDSEGEIDILEELRVDNSISIPKMKISVVMNDNDELECLDPGEEFDISTNEKDDNCFPFIFVIQIFLPYLSYPKLFSFLLSVESEDTIFDPGISI